jgi:hypothetical protein
VAGALLRDLGELAAEVSEVEVEKNGDLRVVLRGAGEVVRMGAPPYRSRLVTFLSLREEFRVRCPRAEWFDLRFRDRIYVMQPPEAVLPVPPAAPAVTGPEPPPPAPPPAMLIPAASHIPPLPAPGDLRVR